MSDKFKQVQTFSSESMVKFSQHIAMINAMVQVVNEETKKYNQLESFTKEKIVLATEINNANIQVLNKKFELIVSHIEDIYERLDILSESLKEKL